MKNILQKNKQPEFTIAMRAEMLADLDTETSEHERREYEFAKEKLGGLATGESLETESEESISK